MGRVEGKVAFVTGAARGQGRSHAVRLAQEGADIIAIDICAEIEGMRYPSASASDLSETVRQVETMGRRIISSQADVRNFAALAAVVETGIGIFGHIDIVCANAGITNSARPAHELSEHDWQTLIDVNLTGTWNTVRAAVPHMIEANRGGAIVLTSSVAGLRGYGNLAHYVAAKHGIVGLMRTLALELASSNIRVNSVHPSNVDTPMIMNDATFRLFSPSDAPNVEHFREKAQSMNALPVPWVEPIDISNAVLFLVSDEARFITGVTLPIDAGTSLK